MKLNSIRRNLKLEDILSEITLLCGKTIERKDFCDCRGRRWFKIIKLKFNDNTHMDSNRFQDVMALKEIVNFSEW